MKAGFIVFYVLTTTLMVTTGCKDDDVILDVPEVSTLEVTDITSNAALGGGIVTADGGSPVISRGVVWSIEPDPTLENHAGLKSEGTGLGVFTATISGLYADQTYFFRAFATNATGTSYGQYLEFNSLNAESPAYPPGTIHCIENGAEVVRVYSPVSGKIWMDRNLGAGRVATVSSDEGSFGDLYQWGRFSDGHQCRQSSTTNNISENFSPPHGNFIISSISDNWNWLQPQNDNLWQGVNGINNPCPEGFRVPTAAEWKNEGLGENTNPSYAFYSPLKLPAAGFRNRHGDALVVGIPDFGYYWSSTVSGSNIKGLHLQTTAIYFFISGRSNGGSVRCIMD